MGRDIATDYLNALREEYASYKAAGIAKADEVAEALAALGFDPREKAMEKGAKQRVVAPAPTERAVEADAPPKKPGRPARKRQELATN